MTLYQFEGCTLCAIVLTAEQDAFLLTLALEGLSLLGCVEGIRCSLLLGLGLCLAEKLYLYFDCILSFNEERLILYE